MEHLEKSGHGAIAIIVGSDRISDVERACQQAQALRAAGVTVTLVIPEPAGDRVSRARDSGAAVHAYSTAAGEPTPFPLVATLQDAVRAGRKLHTWLSGTRGADVVQFCGVPEHFALSAALLKISGKRIVFDLRRRMPSENPAALNAADAVITSTPQDTGAVQPRSQCFPELAWGGLTPRAADPADSTARRRHLVLCACDGGAEDNVEGIMRTLRRIMFGLERNDVQLGLIAPPSRHKDLMLAARAEGVHEHVYLIDAGDRAALSRALSAAELALDPTRKSAMSEAFMSSFVECCIQFGLPLVAFKRRVLAERLQDAALFSSAEDVPELADCILDVLDFADQRAAQREKMRGRKRGCEAAEAARQQYADFMLSLIAARRPQPSAPEVVPEPEVPVT